MRKPYKLIAREKTPGRNGRPNITLLVGVKKKLYSIVLVPEYFRYNKEGVQEVIYRCTVTAKPAGYPLYSGFEHPKSAIEHFLRKADVLK